MSKNLPLPETDENEFFADINRIGGTGCCTARAVLWLGIILVVIGVGIIWVKVRPVSLNSLGSGASADSITTQSFFGSRSTNQIPNDEFTVHVSDDELTQSLRHINQSTIEDLSAHIHTQNIVIMGTLSSPIRLPLQMTVEPKVASDGTVSLQLDDLTVGGIRALPLATPTLRQQISQAISDLLTAKFSGHLTKIVLGDGTMTAFLRLN